MSKRNSQEAKRDARERLREERERQAKREKFRRQLVIGGSIVAVLGVAAGVGVAVTNMSDGSSGGKVSNADWKSAAKKSSYAEPANTSGAKGTTVDIGKKGAKNTLQVFEDMRCPICAQFEQSVGETVTKGMEDGTYKLRFTMGTFLDEGQLKGSGSHNALSALGAALNVSPEAFIDYKKALFSAKNHPEETEDTYSDDAKLIKVAQEVKELKGNDAFDKDVKDGTYDRWALALSDTFAKAKDVTGTPTLKLNGTKLVAEGSENAPMTAEAFTAALDKALKE